MNVNVLDVLVVIPILWGGFKGFKNGMISEGGTLLALILGIWASVSFSDSFGSYVEEYLSISNEYKEIVAFGTIFILVVIVSFMITSQFRKFFKAVSLEWLDKLLGIGFGAAKFLVIVAFIFFLINTLVDRYSSKEVKLLEESLFFKPLSASAKAILDGNIAIPEYNVPFVDDSKLLDSKIEELEANDIEE